MEILWDDLFKKHLNFNPNGADVLLTETPLNPKAIREKMTSIMFEKFKVNRL